MISRPNDRSEGAAGAAGKILVTGATGHVGSELIAELLRGGHSVRAMTRRPEALVRDPRVEAVRGDFAEPASLESALDGIARVFSMSAQPIFGAPTPTHDLALAEACRRAGVRRIVKLSALGGGGHNPDSPIVRWVRAAEASVTESGADWTLLRPGRFMTNTLAWAPMIRRGAEVSIPMAYRRTASIDPADVARVAALALTGEGHAGKTYELSGPESLTSAEELDILSQALGRPLRLNALANDAARAGMLRYGMPEFVVDAILAESDSKHGSEVLPTVLQLTGRPPRRFADWVAAQRTAFEEE
jgi:uncharacterized protein YbjT (DUF2867 family)